MALPTIVIVPGFWEGTAPFDPLINVLKEKGFQVALAPLRSTGTISPGNPGMHDDIVGIRTVVENIVGKNESVALFLHSAGGFLGSNAIKGLTLQARQQQGLRGGVSQIVFLSGAVFPLGYKHGPLPFARSDGGAIHLTNPREMFFNDFDDDSAQYWLEKLQTHPSDAWDDTVTFCGWQEVPSVYIICEKDACLPESFQMQLARTGGSKVERVAGGHLAMLSIPNVVAEIVAKHAVQG